MRKTLTLFLMGNILLANALKGVDLTGYERVWYDDFSGDTLNPDYWTAEVGEGIWNTEANRELQIYTDRPSNLRIDNGRLIIEAHREDFEGSGRYPFTSARVNTAGRVKFQYGILKARIRLPDLANGLWPAFWTLGDVDVGWPENGEIDILEAGLEEFILDGTVNQSSAPRVHWAYPEESVPDPWNYHTYFPSPWNTPPQDTISVQVDSLQEYHDYILEWTETEILVYMNDAVEPFYRFEYDPELIFEFTNPQAIILNLAVGGSITGIPTAAGITAPFPAKMEIESIELWQKPGVGSLYLANEARREGKVAIGAFAEGTDGLEFDSRIPVDEEFGFIYSWNNLDFAAGEDPSEGVVSLYMNVPDPGQWFGGGIQTLSNYVNYEKFVGGTLNLDIKTSTTAPFRIGIGSMITGNREVAFAANEEKYGLRRDGQWHSVSIPLGDFGEIDLKSIHVHFYIVGDPPGVPFQMEIDNLYWEQPTTELPTPENGNYGIFTETAANRTAGHFGFDIDGQIFLWENTLIDGPATTPSEGNEVFSFMSAPGLNWFGLGVFASRPVNLTAFEDGALEFDLKTTSGVPFRVGMKTDIKPGVGQVWIDFPGPGQDPYGFVRDGQWHSVVIPMADLKAHGNLNLFEVVQLFQMLGVSGGITNLHIDNIFFSGGGEARRDRWTSDSDPVDPVDPVDPDPVALEELFPGSEVDGDWTTTWAGKFHTQYYPWVYRPANGWLYLSPVIDETGIWYFNAHSGHWAFMPEAASGHYSWVFDGDGYWE